MAKTNTQIVTRQYAKIFENKIINVSLQLATSDDVKTWSHGEVTKPETINYKTYKPERYGLFDEVIFGPQTDFKCPICSTKYKRSNEGQVCEKTDECKIFQPEILSSSTRRTRMGHIELAKPVVHFWFNKVDHSVIAKLLGLEYATPVPFKDDGTVDKKSKSKTKTKEEDEKETKKVSTKAAARREIDDIIYFRSHIILEDGGLKSLPKSFILNVNNAAIFYRNAFYELLGIHKENKNQDAIDEIEMAIEELEDLATSSIGKDYGIDFYEYNDIIETYSEAKIGTGATAIEYLLDNVDVKVIAAKVKREITSINKTLDEEFKKGKPVNSKIVRRDKLYKRLEVLNGFVASGQDPKSMLIYNLPVMPADLRPLIQIDGGRHSTTDVNELYRRIIIRNDRLKKWIELEAPVLVMQNEMRMLQEAVDALIDNSRKKPSPVLSKDNRPLKSIADYLSGKKGRFRQNLLGKRVDYSGRSVIVVGPSLKMHQAGIPREMVAKLFEPWIIKALIKDEIATSIKIAKKMIEELNPKIWPFVEKAIDKKVVLLNRAPTLHRLSIQAFEPVLIRGKAIRLHPLVTAAFNADFDGDQMAVHVPISKKAILEAKELMLANKNILGPKDGEPIINPSQDMILGLHYLTKEAANVEGEGRVFKDYSELEKVYELGKINLHARVAMPVQNAKKEYLKTQEGYIISTVGKFLFNQSFPKNFAFIFDNTNDKGTFSKTYNKYIAKPGTNLREFIKKLPLNHPLTKKDIAKIARKVFDDYVATISKEGLAKIINQVNSSNANDQVMNVAQLINYKGCKISRQHAEVIAERIKSHFEKINKRVTKSNEGVERIFEINEKVELLEKVWFDYTNVVAHTLDNIKDLGFKYSMMSGTTMSISDIILSPKKANIVKGGEKYVQNLQDMYEAGLLTDDERYRLVIKKWAEVKTEVEQDLNELTVDPKNQHNPILNMMSSGARGNISNFVQLAGLRGLMANNKKVRKAFASADITIRSTIEVPVKSSFLEGLTAFEFYTTTPGARKGLTDTALNTANAGYLTRRLVDVAQNIVVREEDCGSGKGFDIKDIVDTKNNTVIVTMEERIKGRFAAVPIINPETGEVIVEHNDLITNSKAMEIVKSGIKKVEIRSVLGCQTKNGICKKCYGKDLATNRIVQIGEPVGVIAAQSIGEPGTQLTMRTFHTGGVAGVEDITGGFDRLKQLIDAIKTPWETPAVISKSVGKVYRIEPKSSKFGDVVVETPFDTEVVCKIHQGDKITTKGTSLTIERNGAKQTIKYNVLGEKDKIIDYPSYPRIAHKNLIVEDIEVTDSEVIFSGKQAEISQYVIGRRIRIKKNSIVKPGDKLVDGPIILTELLEYAGTTAVQNYLIKEIQRLYRMQGISIADKYIEIIVRQMFSKVLISIVGDSSFFAGSLVDINDYRIENAKLLAKGKNPAYGTIQIRGANKIPLLSDSFLAAASYQETAKVLVHSSISGRVDNLEGLKENVILGHRIPAGTSTNYEAKGKYHIVDPKQYFKK